MNSSFPSGKVPATFLLRLGLLLLLASGPAAYAYPVANNLTGSTAPGFTNWNFYQSQAGSMVAGFTDHGRTWALRLVDNGSPRNTAVVFNPPNSDAANRAMRTIDVTFDFSMEDGNGGNGFSFNFADTIGLPLPGSSANQGIGTGLSVNFQADNNAPYGTCGRIQVEWQGLEKGTVVPSADLGGACLWHNSFPNSWYRVRLTVDANGQMQMIISTVTLGGTVTTVTTKSYTLDNWAATVNANWRFLFGARNADDNHRMRVVLDRISLSGDTAPIFSSVPSVTFNEDQPNPSFQFTAGDYENGTVTASAALTDGGGVLSGVQISPSPNTTFNVIPQLIPNASGTARIQLSILAGNLSAAREVVVTVNPVNDVPTLSAIGPGSTPRRHLGISDLHRHRSGQQHTHSHRADVGQPIPDSERQPERGRRKLLHFRPGTHPSVQTRNRCDGHMQHHPPGFGRARQRRAHLSGQHRGRQRRTCLHLTSARDDE